VHLVYFYDLKKCHLLFFLLVFGKRISAQENLTTATPTVTNGKSIFSPKNTRNFSRKGDFFASWGYNRSWYANSDINFRGPGYDFTLRDVKAHDRQSKFGSDYFNPAKISIPQYDLRIGYYFKDNYSISLGWDHMKYVMDIPQRVRIDGYIDPMISSPGHPTGNMAGTYNGQEINVKEEMLTYEHTDGFNYANMEIQRDDDIWVSKSQRRSFTLETGLGAGVFVPRSDVHLFGLGRNNHWNLAGYGFSAKAGLKYYFTRGLYLQNSTKVGYSNLKNVHTTGRDEIDRASQKIKYLENYTVLGYQF